MFPNFLHQTVTFRPRSLNHRPHYAPINAPRSFFVEYAEVSQVASNLMFMVERVGKHQAFWDACIGQHTNRSCTVSAEGTLQALSAHWLRQTLVHDTPHACGNGTVTVHAGCGFHSPDMIARCTVLY